MTGTFWSPVPASVCLRAFHCYCSVAKSCLTLLQPHRLRPTRLLCAWDFPGKHTGVGYHFLLQGIFPTQGSNLCLLLGRWTLTTEPPGKPWSLSTPPCICSRLFCSLAAGWKFQSIILCPRKQSTKDSMVWYINSLVPLPPAVWVESMVCL